MLVLRLAPKVLSSHLASITRLCLVLLSALPEASEWLCSIACAAASAVRIEELSQIIALLQVLVIVSL